MNRIIGCRQTIQYIPSQTHSRPDQLSELAKACDSILFLIENFMS